MKVGTKEFPILHMRGSFCTDSFEPESEYHLQGKHNFLNGCKGKFITAAGSLFSTHPARADIVFEFGGKTYCLEFNVQFCRRRIHPTNKGYRSCLSNHYGFWEKNIQRKQPSFPYPVSIFVFANDGGNHLYLPAYCPETKKFIFLTNIFPVSVRIALAGLTSKPLQAARIDDLFCPTSATQLSVGKWREEMERFKTTTFLRNRNLFNSDFVKELYSLSVHPLLLPPYVGIPLSLNPVIEESPFIWQGYVFLDCLFGKKQGECFSFADAYLSLLKRIEKKQLRSRQLPNINKTLLPFLLFEYLQVLTHQGILHKAGKDVFYSSNDIVLFRTAAESAMEEARFYSQFSIRQCFDGRDVFNT